MNNPSTMTQPRLWTLILGLLLMLQTACTNGVTHLGADGDEEKFLKLLTLEERSFWGDIKDKGFQKTFVEYFFTNSRKKPRNPRHLNLEKGKRYFQGNKDHFIEHVLAKNTLSNNDKVIIIYKYLCGNLVEKIGYIFDYVDDIKSAEKLVKDFCSYLPEHDQKFIDYVFENYEEDDFNTVIQSYLTSKKYNLDYQTKHVLEYMGEDIVDNFDILKGIWGKGYQTNKQYVDFVLNKNDLTVEDIEKAQAYMVSTTAEKAAMVLWDLEEMDQVGVEIMCRLLKYRGDIGKANADEVIVKAIMQSTALQPLEKYNMIYNGVHSSLFELSAESFGMIKKSFGKNEELMLLLAKKGWGDSADVL